MVKITITLVFIFIFSFSCNDQNRSTSSDLDLHENTDDDIKTFDDNNIDNSVDIDESIDEGVDESIDESIDDIEFGDSDIVCDEFDQKDEAISDCEYEGICSLSGEKTATWKECIQNSWVNKEEIMLCQRETDGLNCSVNMTCENGDCKKGENYCDTIGAIKDEIAEGCSFADLCSNEGTKVHSWKECVLNVWTERSETLECSRNSDGVSCGDNLSCINGLCAEDNDPCGGCSGKGTCYIWGNEPVCACDAGYTPSREDGLDCVPTETVCTGGEIDYDVDDDGKNESYFEPSATECLMYESVNYTRAVHDPETSSECHLPLKYNVLWSAHARNHSLKMYNIGSLFHDDHPGGQNVASTYPSVSTIMDAYMNGPGEDHCNAMSHHCNIMRCGFISLGVGFYPPEGTYWNTQNFTWN